MQDKLTPGLAAALAVAQGQFPAIAKNRTVKITTREKGSYTFRYADLENILAAVRPALSANGLAITQEVRGKSLFTVLMHASGEERSSEIDLSTWSSSDIKSYGSILTYLRRYMLNSMLCLAADDDLDENDAANSYRKPAETPRQPQPLKTYEQPVEGVRVEPMETEPVPAREEEQTMSEAIAASPVAAPEGDPIVPGAIRIVTMKLAAAGKTEADLVAKFGVDKVEALRQSQVNGVLAWLKS